MNIANFDLDIRELVLVEETMACQLNLVVKTIDANLFVSNARPMMIGTGCGDGVKGG